MNEFFAMGGYGLYVWSAYGLSCVVLVATVWYTRRGLRNTITHLQRLRHSAPEQQS